MKIDLLKLKKAAFVLGMSSLLPSMLTACGEDNKDVIYIENNKLFTDGFYDYTKILDINSLREGELKNILSEEAYDKLLLESIWHVTKSMGHWETQEVISRFAPLLPDNNNTISTEDGVTCSFDNFDVSSTEYRVIKYEIIGTNKILESYEITYVIRDEQIEDTYINVNFDDAIEYVLKENEIRLKVLVYNNEIVSFEQTGYGSWAENIVEANSLGFALEDVDTNDLDDPSFATEDKALQYINKK